MSGRGGKDSLLKGGLALAWMLAASPCWAQSVSADAAPGVAAQHSAGVAQDAATTPNVPPVQDAAPTSAQPAASTPASAETQPAEPPRHTGHRGAEEEPGIVVSSRPLAPDPGRAINQASFAVTQAIDNAVLEPFSKGYEAVVPSPVRDGIHNALYNLREPVIAANFLMQHKIGKTAETVARFVLNSTIGLAGIFDMAKRKPFRMPFRENGFADTMGFYGVPNGPYIYMPLFGSTTLRDLTGRIVDRAALPLAIGRNVLPTAAVVPMIVLGIVDRRVVNKERLRQEKEAADPYTTTRDNYLRRRADQIEGLRHPHGEGEGGKKAEKEEEG
ncbi:phospholipid-binding lipoprotein MlaA [Novosphingobium sp. SG751A]|uniref:MlaA family lipoprotein n=1 Tax=Novosphingobium sp. SG751A TaxID=2587000 RepID=UPI001556547E|nr:phospholipid-binding lipoprotein MlaA [Novosphingobium sp. SG751A]